jgi:phosphatidylinositol-3-phosphatase
MGLLGRRRRLRRATLFAAAAAALIPLTGWASSASATTGYTPGSVKHVIWILMENHSEPAVIGSAQAPYINSLAAQFGLATNYHNISHPSVPNYLGLTSGLPLSSLPKTDCTNCRQSVASVFTQGETWRSYQESMQTPCARVLSPDKLYFPRHNPALYYTRISDATCKADDLAYPALTSDLSHGTLPAFSFVTPNIIDDMHDGTVSQGDTWLKTHLPAILASSQYRAGSVAVFITWDEGSGTGGSKGFNCIASPTATSCRVALLAIDPYTAHGARATIFATHYSLLRLTEDLLGLPRLGLAASAPDLAPSFGL